VLFYVRQATLEQRENEIMILVNMIKQVRTRVSGISVALVYGIGVALVYAMV
jgi:hypothetical protein